MLKADERDDPQSCFNKAQEDEPVFVLRAQDILAPKLVRLWAFMAELGYHPGSYGAPRPSVMEGKLDEALALADEMERWQSDHPDDVKIPD